MLCAPADPFRASVSISQRQVVVIAWIHGSECENGPNAREAFSSKRQKIRTALSGAAQ
jgi:hypothetical protein